MVMLYFKKKNISNDTIYMKQLAVLPSDIYLPPYEIYNTLVYINTNLQLDINICNSLVYEARLNQ